MSTGEQWPRPRASRRRQRNLATARPTDTTRDQKGRDPCSGSLLLSLASPRFPRWPLTHVTGGSGVNLGEDTGDTILARPNSTTTNNAGFGIRCEVGGYADGRLGSLNGDGGAQSHSEGCIDSLIPPK